MSTKKEGAFVLLGCIIVTSVLTYLLTKAKYEKKPVSVEPEIEPEQKPEVKSKAKDEIPLQPMNAQKSMDVTQYAEKYKNQHAALIRDYIPDQENDAPVIEIIDEDLFDSNPAYETAEYTLFSNGVLTDEKDEVVNDPENSVGRHTIERFNELEHNDAVYVRNHELKMDFAIFRVARSWTKPVGGSHADRA